MFVKLHNTASVEPHLLRAAINLRCVVPFNYTHGKHVLKAYQSFDTLSSLLAICQHTPVGSDCYIR